MTNLGQDSKRLIAVGRWLFRRYVQEMEAGNPAGAVGSAKALFYIKYGTPAQDLFHQWEAFEMELYRLAVSEKRNSEDAHRQALGF